MQETLNHNIAIKRGYWVPAFLGVGLAALTLMCGWLVPAHLRAVESVVLRRAGENTPNLVDRGLELVRAGNISAARMIWQATQAEKTPRTEELGSSLRLRSEPEPLFPSGPMETASTPVTTDVMRLQNRQRVFAYLQSTGSPAVQELIRARDLTNTVLFPPSTSASGQAFDAAVSVCGLLLAGNHLTPGLRDALVERAAFGRTHADAQSLEEVLMDFLSLGERLTLGQLVALVSHVEDPATLTLLAGEARNAGAHLPEMFAAVVISQQPDQVAAYLNSFSQTGLNDLSASLRDGEGGVDELVQRHQPLHSSPYLERWMAAGPLASLLRTAADFVVRDPGLALAMKWLFYLIGGFFLASALHFARMAVAETEPLLRVPGVHLARELLFALGFLVVVLLLTEPFLVQESQKAEFAFRWRLPLAGAATTSNAPLVKSKLMDTRSLLTLSLFFVLQGLIYCACLVKLAEIRRQKLPPRVQLRLLENEEHLFDGGLYLGFAGTIVCLILVSLGIIQQSLMAAYSSTSFGIIFVSIFKIFNLRPARRQLLLQAEAPTFAPEKAVSAAPTFATAE